MVGPFTCGNCISSNSILFVYLTCALPYFLSFCLCVFTVWLLCILFPRANGAAQGMQLSLLCFFTIMTGVSLEIYRAAIGYFNCYSILVSRTHLGVSLRTLLSFSCLSLFLLFLLLSSGDIHLNPGPRQQARFNFHGSYERSQSKFSR